eukprot:6305922-Prymnesium_polylepis.1
MGNHGQSLAISANGTHAGGGALGLATMGNHGQSWAIIGTRWHSMAIDGTHSRGGSAASSAWLIAGASPA